MAHRPQSAAGLVFCLVGEPLCALAAALILVPAGIFLFGAVGGARGLRRSGHLSAHRPGRLRLPAPQRVPLISASLRS